MKKIPGFSGLYATRDGRIYSKRIHKYLNLSLNERSGYLQVSDFSITMYTKRFRT